MSSDEEEEAMEGEGGGEPVGVDRDAPFVQAEPELGRTDCHTDDGPCEDYPTLTEGG